MRNLYSDLSPPIPKLHIILKEDYRNSIVDRFSMVFFISHAHSACSQNPLKTFETFVVGAVIKIVSCKNFFGWVIAML